MARKLIFLDNDGTLTNKDGIVPDSAATAIKEARKRGHLVYICSGRIYYKLKEDVLSIGFDGVVSSGGAYIETGDTTGERSRLKVIYDAVVPPDLVKKIVAYLNSRQCGFALEKSDKALSNAYYISHWEDLKGRYVAAGNDSKASAAENFAVEKRKNVLGGDHESYGDDVYEGVKRLLFSATGDTPFDLIKKEIGHMCEVFHCSIPHSGEEDGEIPPLDNNKGTALKKTAEYHGIPLSDTIAFGDSDNDRTMFEVAEIGVAMGNSKDGLEKVADLVTDSSDDDGIYNGFKKLGLI